MSHSNSTLGNVVKALLVAILKVLGIALAFVFKLAALILEKSGDILEKMTGNDKHH